ncbi:MAG: zinc ribbon domain-containing protein, partial [Oscillospiraceae bacterium]|nr:zinc ribbon domain-containing protein [Oscillospiraceae bacterium]
MNKQLIIKIGGIVSAIIYALGAVFPLASAEIFGTTVSASLLDGGDWVYVIINAALVIAGMLLSEHTALILCAITSGLLAFLELKRFFDGSSEQFSAFLTKGAGFYCLLIGAILVVGFCIAMQFISDAPKSKAKKTSSVKKCPFCAEKIKADAKLCRYCGSKLDENVETSAEDDSDAPAPEDDSLKGLAKQGGRLLVSLAMIIASAVLLAFIIIFSIGGILNDLDTNSENSSVTQTYESEEVPEVTTTQTTTTAATTTTTKATTTTRATTTTTATTISEPTDITDYAYPIEAYFVQNDNFSSSAVEGGVPYIHIKPDGTFEFQCNKYTDVLIYKGTWSHMVFGMGVTSFMLEVTSSNYGNVDNDIRNTPIMLTYYNDSEPVVFDYQS